MSERRVIAFPPHGETPAGDVVEVDLFYPRAENKCHTIEVGLCDVRAADSIRITYDFDRDGWCIWQENSIDHGDYSEATGQWVEVAFVKAWQLSTPATLDS